MATRMQQRRGTAAQWTSANPVLAAGEIGFETDTNKFKMGDGVNTWSNLTYFIDEDGVAGSLGDYVEVASLGDIVATLGEDGKLTSTQIPASLASTTYVDTAISNLIDAAPAALDTLNELAAALNDDATFSTTVTNSLAGKIDKSVVTTTGDLIIANGNASVTRLGIGTNGQVLQSNGTTATWSTPSSGGMTLLSSGTILSNGITTISNIPQNYVSLVLYMGRTSGYTVVNLNNVQDGNGWAGTFVQYEFHTDDYLFNPFPTGMSSGFLPGGSNTNALDYTEIHFPRYTANNFKYFWAKAVRATSPRMTTLDWTGKFNSTAAITSIIINTTFNASSTGSYQLYGIK